MLSRPCSNKGPHMHGAREISWFFSSCGGRTEFLCRYPRELREPLVLPQGSQVSIRLRKGSTVLLWIIGRESGLKSHVMHDLQVFLEL